ncbi:hypothetical protein [Halorussus halophilus]|uniref:hypothetical protein n=1 Tax=Halorussus halophilus TaxID=2650975 RepID=UPI0013017841|nr:hypothetical protein [Halorussus halophilus]
MALPRSRSPRWILTWSLLVTAAVSTLFGILALADILLGTTFWLENVEYGPQLVVVGWLFLKLRSESEQVERWEWISVPCFVGFFWLVLAAAYTNPEGVLTILALFLLFVGLAFGLGGKYKEWSKGKTRS